MDRGNVIGRRPVVDFKAKNDLIVEYVTGRRVLHLGAVGETCQDTELRVERAKDSAHSLITAHAEEAVGVDHDEPSVRLLTERGIFGNLICADVTTLTRGDVPLETVDLIFVGDTIEHLAEPGKVFEVADRLADPATQLLITTPNALGLGLFLKNLRDRPIEGPDHVCSFNAYTLANLIERSGWTVLQLGACYQPKAAALNPRLFRAGRAVLERVPRLGGTLYAVCARGPSVTQ